MPWEVLGLSLTLSVCASTRTFLTSCLLKASMGTQRHQEEHVCSYKGPCLDGNSALCGGRLVGICVAWHSAGCVLHALNSYAP